ncbi:MAG: hypothetical protein ABIZ91_15795 [Gemmatimonadaceae bacterium]
MSAVRDLAFGTVLTGSLTSVAPTDVKAAYFKITGVSGVNGGFTFTLPSQLTRGGGGTLPVTFCTTCGIYKANSSNPVGGTTFNPNTSVTGLIYLTSTTIHIWLGASLNPPLAQQAGAYSATVVLTLIPFI